MVESFRQAVKKSVAIRPCSRVLMQYLRLVDTVVAHIFKDSEHDVKKKIYNLQSILVPTVTFYHTNAHGSICQYL